MVSQSSKMQVLFLVYQPKMLSLFRKSRSVTTLAVNRHHTNGSNSNNLECEAMRFEKTIWALNWISLSNFYPFCTRHRMELFRSIFCTYVITTKKYRLHKNNKPTAFAIFEQNNNKKYIHNIQQFYQINSLK